MSAVNTTVVANDGYFVWPTGTPESFKRGVRAQRFPDGIELVLRLEPKEDAWRYSDLKHYFGYLVEPVARHTGYTKMEVHAELFKAMFMPEGKASLIELNREELTAFKESVEQFIRQELPELELPVWEPPR